VRFEINWISNRVWKWLSNYAILFGGHIHNIVFLSASRFDFKNANINDDNYEKIKEENLPDVVSVDFFITSVKDVISCLIFRLHFAANVACCLYVCLFNKFNGHLFFLLKLMQLMHCQFSVMHAITMWTDLSFCSIKAIGHQCVLKFKQEAQLLLGWPTVLS